VYVVGNSSGGAVALRLALVAPARVWTVTLVDSGGLGREVNPLLALKTLPVVGEQAIMISRLPGGDVLRTSMSTAMLFAQPSRVPADFLSEQHALGKRPGQLEASTAMARALFDANRQLGRVRPGPPAIPGAGRGAPPAPREARAARGLRTPAPRGVPRPVRHGAEPVAR
jgi:pimeloyl-ACP methyl ester carboxylesterase